MGASSARIALGTWAGGTISHHVVETVHHMPKGRCWDVEALEALCRRAHGLALAEGATLGIDTWGVDLCLFGPDGSPKPPVCYRDESHAAAFQEMSGYRDSAFAATGIADQPFNTVYQLR